MMVPTKQRAHGRPGDGAPDVEAGSTRAPMGPLSTSAAPRPGPSPPAASEALSSSLPLPSPARWSSRLQPAADAAGDDGTEADGSALHIRVEPPVYTRDFEFADTRLEAEYRRDEVQTKLETRAQYVGGALGVLLGSWGMLDVALTGGELVNPRFYVFIVLYSGLWIGLGLFAHVASRRSWPLEWTENCFTLAYVTSCFTGFLALLGGMGVELFDVRTLVAAVLQSRVGIMMQTMVFLALFAVYTPLRPRLYAVIALGAWSAVALNEAILVGRLRWREQPMTVAEVEGLAQSIMQHLLFGTYCVVMVWVNALIAKIHHSAYHFFRSVQASVKERHALVASQAQQELQLRTAEAAKLARSRLIRMVMHDLRSPLLSVANAAGLLEDLLPRAQPGDPDVTAGLRSIVTCSDLMQHIISDMLDFERIDSGRLELMRAPFAVGALLQAAMHTFKGLAESSGVALRCEPVLAAPAPGGADAGPHNGAPQPEGASPWLVGDVRRLQQCVNNGVSNALKFTEPGGTVTLRAWREGAERAPTPPMPAQAESHSAQAGAEYSEWPHAVWRIDVADTGIGLSPDEQAALNNGAAFTQVGKGQLQGQGGTGLGLTIARDILRLHGDGCTARVVSAGAGRGTTFQMRLRLPEAPPQLGASSAQADGASVASSAQAQAAATTSHAGTASEAQAPAAAPAATGAAALSPGASADRSARPTRTPVGGRVATPGPHAFPPDFPPDFRVLHVEDDAVLRRTVALRVRNQLGVPMDSAVDGREAVRLVLREGRRYSVVLMDNQMPHLTGTQATRELREGGFDGVIVGMTGDPAGCPERDEFEASGLSACVDKDKAGMAHLIDVLRSFSVAPPQQAAPASERGTAEPEARAPLCTAVG